MARQTTRTSVASALERECTNAGLRLEDLPLHHPDPFDRILVAQSMEEEMPILTADPLLRDYAATLIW